MVCKECYSDNPRITPLLKPEHCLKNHTQYICSTCGRCICIDRDENMSYLKSGLIENYNYSYHMGYHLHLWFDEKNRISDISELIKSKIKSEEQISIIKQEILVADLSTLEGIDFDELRKICVSEFSTKLVQKVEEITKQIENIKPLTNEFKYLDSDRYLNYIKNLALKYAGKYL